MIIPILVIHLLDGHAIFALEVRFDGNFLYYTPQDPEAAGTDQHIDRWLVSKVQPAIINKHGTRLD